MLISYPEAGSDSVYYILFTLEVRHRKFKMQSLHTGPRVEFQPLREWLILNTTADPSCPCNKYNP